MKLKLKKRVLVVRLATLSLAACGMVAGYLLGCAFSLRVATNWLDKYATLVATQNDASFAEAREVLNDVKSSPYPYCSDAEIAYFRGLVFRSQFMKDAGRIHGEKIDCSTESARRTRSIGQLQPDANQTNGATVYSDFPPVEVAGLKTTALQVGSAYAAFGSQLPPTPGPVPIHLATGKEPIFRQSTPRAADARGITAPFSDTNGTARQGDVLYATRCSTIHSGCVTTYTSVTEALNGENNLVTAFTAIGGALGALLGFAFPFVFNRQRDLSHQLRRAVERNQLQVLYQPIVILATREIVGAEALARWTDEEGNVVDPEVFVKIAEENGFVGELTKAVLHRSLHDFALTLQTRPGFRLSVNVSGMDLVDPAFLPMLEESLKRTRVKPQSLVIEISEKSTAKSDVAMETIRLLRRAGHSIHIDDFGTGYSNLDKLLYLFADTIKIDKAFTGVIGTESVAVAILPQILALAKSLNLEVVVEGVETDHQADYFSPDAPQLYGQGWLYGRPVSAEKFQELVVGNIAVAIATEESVSHVPVIEGTEAEFDAEWTAKPGSLHIVSSNPARRPVHASQTEVDRLTA